MGHYQTLFFWMMIFLGWLDPENLLLKNGQLKKECLVASHPNWHIHLTFLCIVDWWKDTGWAVFFLLWPETIAGSFPLFFINFFATKRLYESLHESLACLPKRSFNLFLHRLGRVWCFKTIDAVWCVLRISWRARGTKWRKDGVLLLCSFQRFLAL